MAHEFTWQKGAHPDLGSHLQKPAPERDHDSVGTITGVELGEDALKMILDRVLGDVEVGGDDPVGASSRNAPQRRLMRTDFPK